jgi:CBS domain-containing protein
MFGGVAQLERDSDSPGTELKIALAGPAVTALIIVVFGAIGIALTGASDFLKAMRIDGNADVAAVPAVLGWITFVSIWLLGFNLIPAFPLDGGRVARAIIWWRTGDRARATRVAATLGQVFAYILFGVAVFLFIDGDVFSAIWLAFIGFILRGAARGAVAQTEITSRIEGVSVGDVMDREPVAIPDRLPVGQALDEYFLRYGYPWFPVTDADRRFIGLIDQGAAEMVPATERTATTVGDVLARDSGTASVSEDSPLEALLSNQALRRLGALAAVDSQGRLRGMVTLDAVGRALRP